MRVAENNDTCVKRAQENGPIHPPASSTTTKKKVSSAQAQEEDDEAASPAEFCCGDKAQVRLLYVLYLFFVTDLVRVRVRACVFFFVHILFSFVLDRA